MDNAYQRLVQGRSKEFSASEKDRTLLAIFAVLCWTSMTIHHDLQLDQSDNRPLGILANGVRTEESSQLPLTQTARRPITKVFRVLKASLESSRHGSLVAEATDGTTLYESSINFFSLKTIGRVKIKWMEDLSCHLHFDRQYRTLSVFCLPTFCVTSILRQQEISALQL